MQQRHGGFTIIEVVLFLGISSLLAMALLTGVMTTIRQQQYRDAVQSFASFLQTQYSSVLAVHNDQRSATCPLDGTVRPRGQSPCVIVGRYIRSADNVGQQYRAYPVYALRSGDTWRYALAPDSQAAVYQLNWSVRSRLAGATSEGAIDIGMYRHPDTGQLAIRMSPTHVSSADIGAFLTMPRSHESTQEICLYDDRWLTGQRQSIFLSPRAGSGDAVVLRPGTERCQHA